MSQSVYLGEAFGSAGRLLSALDREPLSVTFGSFDREHWGWKFRDWPRGMLQNTVYPVSLLWRHPFPGSAWHGNGRLLEWIAAAIDVTVERQRPNGAVDAFAPNDQDPGVTLMTVHDLTESLRLAGAALPPELVERVKAAVRRACDFSFLRDESHGFVSNHWALFAMAYWNAAELLSEPRYLVRAESIIDRILEEQSPDGWFREYEGPDPGYESLGIFYLAKYWRRSRSARLLDSLRRSVEFFAHCVHPDGSVGGGYGSRHTSLYFPGGFEILGPEIPMAAGVAAFMREMLRCGNVVTPSGADAENLSPLTASYLEAALCRSEGPTVAPVHLPCQELVGPRDFPDSGIRVFGTGSYYAVWNGRKGGVCRVFDKARRTLAYEDAGYAIFAGGRTWLSQVIGQSQVIPETDSSQCTSEGVFTEWRQRIPTPWNFLFLRVLNLTLFRSAALGQMLRNAIVRELILIKRPGPFRFRRSVSFRNAEVRFSDVVQRTGPMVVDDMRWARTLTGIHMGSAKYFHPSELERTHSMPLPEAARRLLSDREQWEFVLRF
jgi:hypothetical protein